MEEKGLEPGAGGQRAGGPDAGGATSDEVPPQPFELQIVQSLRRIIRATDLYSRRLEQAHHITAPQLICLLAAANSEDITVTELAREVYLSPSTVVGILDRLEHKGLIARSRNSKDRRVVIISVTEKGRELSRTAPVPLQDSLSEALKKLTRQEQAQITDSLSRLVSMMEIMEVKAAPMLTAGPIPAADAENPEG